MQLVRQPISEIDPREWDDLVRGSPDGWSFGLTAWQKVVTGVPEWGFEEHGFGLRRGSELVAAVPLHYQPASRTAGSSGWGGTGPMVSGLLTGEARSSTLRAGVEAAVEQARRLGAERLQLSSVAVTEASLAGWERPLGGECWSVNHPPSQLVDLRPDEEALWAGLSKTARNLVRRAGNDGFSVRSVEWRESVDSYYEIHCETYRRTGVTPHPRAYFAGIASHMAPIGANRLLAIFSPAGEPVGYHNTAVHGRGAFYHTGCSRDAAQAASVGYPLMWEALRAARAADQSFYECGAIFPASTDPKLRGLTLFKTRFGGREHAGFAAHCAIAAQARPAQPATSGLLSWIARRWRGDPHGEARP